MTSAAWATDNCVLTEEYIDARAEVRNIVFGDDSDYAQCTRAASTQAFWLAVSACTDSGGGENIGGGCAHVVGHGENVYWVEPEDSHCEVFKFERTTERAKEMLQQVIEARGIQVCEENGT